MGQLVNLSPGGRGVGDVDLVTPCALSFSPCPARGLDPPRLPLRVRIRTSTNTRRSPTRTSLLGRSADTTPIFFQTFPAPVDVAPQARGRMWTRLGVTRELKGEARVSLAAVTGSTAHSPPPRPAGPDRVASLPP